MNSRRGKKKDDCGLQRLGKQPGKHRQEEDEDRRDNPCGRASGVKDRTDSQQSIENRHEEAAGCQSSYRSGCGHLLVDS
ncbi:MAG: hypothetical protein Q4A78_01845 [Peptostreptococcaceae bacterium]|nr:hypothetical protein [Peptostreptococcaceae bacterium]